MPHRPRSGMSHRRFFLFGCLALLGLPILILWVVFHFRLGPFRPSPWYTYSVQLSDARTVRWRQRMVPDLLMRGVVTHVAVPDVHGIEQGHDTMLPGDWWLPNAEFRVAPDGEGLWVVTEERRLDISEPAKHDVVAYLDLRTGSFVPGDVTGGIDIPHAQHRLGESKTVDRWMLLHVEKPAVLLHWSDRFHGTTVRYAPRNQDEQMAVVIETSDPCYRTAVDPVPSYSNVLLRAEAGSDAVCGYVDT